ncbi:MAG: biopolymer transporter ExbD [Ignavibacteria bacterium]|jgi:biopolymer transport protein ExbD|nr:biopolymer transporter ExbD [Ignavibacteria bacterium]HEX2960742.1 biopolymer transporter ExbD [Ignavibacteriales bacterium]MCU7499252.1 biopolymer transporter ExbD [Ignavibacteria bacterium]MCU7504499.1 biopolymer transporter ExbD [Ignavibacteria bacterium]MCU7512282.1 biopolymer transporter ExbD [Ignavibacteria bacterium]
MAELDTSKGGGHGKGKKKKGKKMSTRVDLTPMVDLGFLLVTFFMLTTTFSKPQTMEINLPVKADNPKEQADAPAVKASKTMTILLGETNKVFWYKGMATEDPEVKITNFSEAGIRKDLLEQNQMIKDMVVLIKPTDKSTYKNMVDILDEMNICNIKRFALVDADPKDMDLIKNK